MVLGKDLTIEFRTGEVLTTSGFFALLVVMMASMSFHGGPWQQRVVAAGVIWLSVAFAAVLALGRSWQREREEHALDGLLAAPLFRSAIFSGKALGLELFLLVVFLVVLPVTAMFCSVDLADRGPGLLVVGLVATPGVAATGTLFGALTVRTRARDLLLAIVLFPLLAPTLLAAVVATRELLGGAPLAEIAEYLGLMGVFDVVFVFSGVALFGGLVEG
jgi:heme exporter protein B